MLTPEYLSKIAEGSEYIAQQLHEYIVRQIVDRMMIRLGRGEDYLLTSSDVWRIKTLQDAGYLLEDITAELAKFTRLQKKEIKEAMEDAGVKAIEYDDRIYQAAGLSPLPLWESPSLVRLMERNYNATVQTWENYTRSTAEAAQRLFLNECDLAYNKVMSGATSYTQAIMEAIESVATSGVVVTYPTGHKDTIEVATARAVRTGIGQASAQISMKRMEEMDWDIVLVSAHLGARTGDGGQNPGNHSWWQGKFYSRTGRDQKFPPLSLTGYGTGEGLCGWNCRHSLGSGDGVNNPYEKLRETDQKDAGKTEALEKRQRELERRIRKTKREVAGMQESVNKCQDETLKKDLQKVMDRKSSLLEKQNKAYQDYCKENDLRPQMERLQIAKWGREQAKNARLAAIRYKNRFKIDGSNSIIRDRVTNGEYSLKLSKQHYLKHVLGTKQYADYEQSRILSGKSPQSRLLISEQEAQDLINEKYGTGIPKITKDGMVKNAEYVDVDKVIGQCYVGDAWVDTKRAAIHYGKKSSHVFPVEE